MKAIWTAGEALCEIMRETCDVGLEAAGTFRGPFPSGAPAIFADTAAKLGCPSGLIGTELAGPGLRQGAAAPLLPWCR